MQTRTRPGNLLLIDSQMCKDAHINLTRISLLLAAAGLAACSSGNPRSTGERISAGQFVTSHAPAASSSNGAASPAAPPTTATAGTADPTPSPAGSTASPATASTSTTGQQVPTPRPMPETLALRSFVGEPQVVGTPAKPTDNPIVLESVIGQINGRPLFASEVLTPLDGRLRAAASEVGGDRTRFMRATSQAVTEVVTRKVIDELMLAEAQASLPPETRQGLFYFLGKIQQNLVSTQAGSALQADEALRETTGRTLQQQARELLERELINNEMRSKVMPRVNVPWRLIRQDYERNSKKYDLPGSATLRVITVPAADADAVRRAEEAIASKPFAEAAAMDFNGFLQSQGGLAVREVAGPYGEAPLFADAAWNDAAWKLQPGQTSPPTPVRTNLVWVHLERLEPGSTIPLYDAQTEIDGVLRDRKFQQERDVYLQRLLARGSFTPLESMAQEAMVIAIERYLSPGAR